MKLQKKKGRDRFKYLQHIARKGISKMKKRTHQEKFVACMTR